MDRREFLIKAVSPFLFTVILFIVWEIVCGILAVPLTILVQRLLPVITAGVSVPAQPTS